MKQGLYGKWQGGDIHKTKAWKIGRTKVYLGDAFQCTGVVAFYITDHREYINIEYLSAWIGSALPCPL